MSLVLTDASRVVWVGPAGTVELVCQASFEPEDLAEAAAAGLDQLVGIGSALRYETRPLSRSLREIGVTLPLKIGPLPPEIGIHLSELLSQAGQGDVPFGLVLAGNEALWIPRATSPSLVWDALRLFIGRMRPPRRMTAYAALAAGFKVAVREEGPTESILRSVLVASREMTEPTALALRHPEVAVIGRWGALGPEGRLGAADLVGMDRWELDSGESIHCAAAVHAPPRLDLVDPFRTMPEARVAVGCSPDAPGAVARAMSEALERFAVGDPDVGLLEWAAARDLDGHWLDPRRVIAYSEAQRLRQSLAEFSEGSPEWWIQGGEGEDHRSPVWVPAALVFDPFRLPAWLLPGAVNTSGAAVHPDESAATLLAWLEFVERDAFWMAWAHRSPLPRVRRSSLSRTGRALLADIGAHPGVDDAAVLVLPGSGGVPAYMAVASGSAVGLCIGSAAGEPLPATVKALAECLLQVRHPFRPRSRPEDVRSPADHGGFYRLAEQRERAGWLLESQEEVSLLEVAPPPTDLPPSAVVVRLPSRVLGGRTAVRVLDPSLVPLTFGFDNEPLGVPRLRSAFEAGAVELNEPLPPHPFA